MDCPDAKTVWLHPDGPIKALQDHFPQVWDFLQEQVEGFLKQTPDWFNTEVHASVNSALDYRITHRGDEGVNRLIHDVLGDGAIVRVLEKWVFEEHGRNLSFSNVCCSSCITADRDFFKTDEFIAVQIAAVQIQIEA